MQKIYISSVSLMYIRNHTLSSHKSQPGSCMFTNTRPNEESAETFWRSTSLAINDTLKGSGIILMQAMDSLTNLWHCKLKILVDEVTSNTTPYSKALKILTARWRISPFPGIPPFLSVSQQDHSYAMWLVSSVACYGCNRQHNPKAAQKSLHKNRAQKGDSIQKDLQFLSTKARESCIIQQDLFKS